MRPVSDKGSSLRGCKSRRESALSCSMEKLEGGAKDHILRLDVVRAVAFLLVFFFHFYAATQVWHLSWNGLWRDYRDWSPYALPLVPLMWGGVLGVPLFFVLSGFCIHLSVLRRPEIFRAGDFYWRRFLRIYPAYFVCLIVCVLLAPWLPYKYAGLYQIPPHLLLVHNLVKSTFLGINGAFWSLGVEAQFYLLYPLLLLGRARWGLPGCFVGSLVLNLLFQIFFGLTHNTFDAPISVDWSFPLVTWCDWILGACLAEAYLKEKRFFTHGRTVMLLSLGLFVAAQNDKALNVQSFLFASVFFAAFMDGYLAGKRPLSRLERGLVPIGLISYSLYLWHPPLITLTFALASFLGLPAHNLAWNLIYLPMVVVFLGVTATLSYRWIEIGFPRLLKGARKTKRTSGS